MINLKTLKVVRHKGDKHDCAVSHEITNLESNGKTVVSASTKRMWFRSHDVTEIKYEDTKIPSK